MTYSIVEANPKAHRDILVRLQKECLPEADLWPIDGSFWWLAKDGKGQPVGFAGLHVANHDDGTGTLCRGGVVPSARGYGLQRKLIQARERRARELGLRRLTTYTHIENVPSMNNIIASGFHLYAPPKGWAEPDFLYWEKEL